MTRDEAVNKMTQEAEEVDDTGCYGFGGEMALAAGSKKAQQRLKKKLNQQ